VNDLLYTEGLGHEQRLAYFGALVGLEPFDADAMDLMSGIMANDDFDWSGFP
jgi:hypothetical protein